MRMHEIASPSGLGAGLRTIQVGQETSGNRLEGTSKRAPDYPGSSGEGNGKRRPSGDIVVAGSGYEIMPASFEAEL